jgi:hypothetical protein
MRFSRTGTVLAGAAIIGTLSGGVGAFAASQITSSDIKNHTIQIRDIKQGGLGYRNLSDYAKNKIESKSTVSLEQQQSEFTPIAKIGGRFADNATPVDSFTLHPGTYKITSNGFFHSLEANSGKTRLQLAVRDADGNDLGTCFTGAASPLADREATCSTTRVVTVDKDTQVDVKAFGYQDDQGSSDSGKFGVVSNVDLEKVS